MKVILTVSALLAVIFTGAFLWAGSFLVVDEEFKSAEYCHVLGGNRKRVEFAIELYREGFCAKVIFIGGADGSGQSYASRQRAYAIDQGVREQDILTDETDVNTTFGEIALLGQMIEMQQPAALRVAHITDGFHTRRVRMVSGWVLSEALDVQVVSVPFEKSFFEEDWWQDRPSRKMVVTEYIKIVFYFFRYRIPFSPLNDLLAWFDSING